MIKTKKDLQILAKMIFDNSIKYIYINGYLSTSDDYVCLLYRIKAGQDDITEFARVNDKLYLKTV